MHHSNAYVHKNIALFAEPFAATLFKSDMNQSSAGKLMGWIIAFALIGSLSFGTSPLPPPYYQFYVRGILERPSGGSKQNFSIILLGKSHYSRDTSFQFLQGMRYPHQGDFPIGLTDSTGAFFLEVSNNVQIDSLRLAAVVPDRPLTLGVPFFVNDSLAIVNRQSYTNGRASGCGSCSTEPGTGERVVSYWYSFDSLSITVSF